jgi:hypothetical protein
MKNEIKFNADVLNSIMNKWIFDTFNVNWIDDNLNINIEKFKDTNYNQIIDQLTSTIQKCEQIDTYESTVEKIKVLNSKSITYNELIAKPTGYTYSKNESLWKEKIKKYENERFVLDTTAPVPDILKDKSNFPNYIKSKIITDKYNEERNNLLNKHPYSIEYMKEYKQDFSKVKPVFDRENEILGDIKIVLTNIKNRLTRGKEICNYRLYEGYFINKSLQEMREDIKDIFYEKQKDNIFISPDYVNLCLEKYCPTHSDCFKKDNKSNNEIRSVIFNRIFNYLINNSYFTINDSYQIKRTQFYKDILISVFCVFNISRSANNPPTVPYIDINELKIAFKIFEKEYNDNVSIKDYKISNDVKNELMKNLKKIYYKIKGTSFDVNENIDNPIQVVTDGSNINENKFDESKTSSIQLFMYNNRNLFDVIYHDNDNILTKLNNAQNASDIFYIKKFIECIDNSNAISAIGTLEFLDQISKYYTTQTICFLEQEQIKPADYTEIYNNDGKFNL